MTDLCLGVTDNGSGGHVGSIPYDWYFAGPGGIAVYFTATIGVHSSADIVAAKRAIKRQRDVIYCVTQWQKDKGHQ